MKRSKSAGLILTAVLTLNSLMLLRSEEAATAEPATVAGQAAVAPAVSDAVPQSLSAGLPDSLAIEKTRVDSLFYVADSIYYDFDKEQIYLFGNTSIKYHDSTILADSLQVDLKDERAFSRGRTVMIDNEQVIIGSRVFYDVNTQTGMMHSAASKLEKGFYYGDEVRKIDEDVYDIDGGKFTTCEATHPHFWFRSEQMRLYRGDKIVGRPVVAYVNHMPIFYFPFVTFSIRRGRHPGFLIPEPGYNAVDGKFVRDIAFFYPYRDYADATFGLDLMERTGWQANLECRYIKRYLFNGNFDASVRKSITAAATNVDYSVRAVHHHELGNRATFAANIDYVSNRRIWEGSADLDESLAQRVTSSLSYRQPLLSSYLNIGSTYTQDLINNTVNLSLLSATYSMPTRPVHEIFTKKDDTKVKTDWWTNFNYSYNVRFDHTGFLREQKRSLGDYIWDNTMDPTGTYYLNQHNLGIKHNLGLNYSYKALGWLNLTQGFNYGEAWMDRDRDGERWVRGNDYSASSSANFTVYGIRNIPRFYVSTVRHIITPSLVFNYSPDFSENRRFYSFGGIGLNRGKKSRVISFGLDQKWQIKLAETAKLRERKLDDVFGWTARMGIDLEKEEKKLTDITHSFSFRPGALTRGKTKLTYSASYNLTQNPYELQWTNWKTRSQFFSHRLSLSGEARTIDYFPRRKNLSFVPYLPPVDSIAAEQIDREAADKYESWSLSLTQDMSADRILWRPKFNNIRFNAAVKVTRNWSLGYSNFYNVTKGEMLSQSFDISRTMHCWKLTISYTRRSDYWDYRIVFFNTELPDALRFQTRDNKRF